MLPNVILATAVIGVVAIVRFQPVHAATGTNEQIDYQGRLLTNTGAVVPDGSYNMEFKIYQDGDGVLGGGDETLKWTETRQSSNKVVVKNGYFSVYLGSVTALTGIDWNQSVLWLSINIGGTGSPSYDGEMSPFTRFSSTPYALNAKQLGGLDKTGFVQLGQGSVQSLNVGTSAVAINQQGAGNLLQLQSSGTDALLVSSAGDVTFGQNANHTLGVTTTASNAAGNSLTLSSGSAGAGATGFAGGDLVLQAGSAAGTSGNANGGNVTISGGSKVNSGTVGYVILQGSNSGNVGIGTSAPNTTLEVQSASSSGIRATSTVALGSGSGGGLQAVTPFTPSAADQRLGVLGFGGITTGTNYGFGAAISAFSSQAWSGTGEGSYLSFFTVANSTLTRLERLRIDQNGNVGIGTSSSPGSLLSVGGTTGNLTVDTSGNVSSGTISSGLINSQTISSTANFTGTVGVATSVTTPLLTSSAALAVTGGTTLALSSTGANSVSLDTGSAAAINIGGTSGSTITYGNTTNSTHIFKDKNIAAAFQIQNASSNNVFSVDTSATAASNQVLLGKASTLDGRLLFNDAAGAHTVSIVAPVSDPTSSYAVNLPAGAPGTAQCLKTDASVATTLTWASCGAGGSSDLQTSYGLSTNPEFSLGSASTAGITIRDNATPISGNLLEIQNSGGTATFLGVTTTAVTLQDSGGNNAFIFDSSSSILKVCENVAGACTNYASISYASGSAIFAASSGTTQIGSGSGGGGNINLILTGAADQLLVSKTNTPGAAYSLSDFNFTRTITGAGNAVTGNVLKVEDLSTFTGGGSSAPNVLYLNQNNTSATGNLILAQTGGGANDKFKVNTAGTVTIAASQSYTGAGALTLQAGASSALTITGNAASTWSTSSGNLSLTSASALTLTGAAASTWSTSSGALSLTSAAAATWGTTTGNLTLQAGGANAVILKPGTDSTTAIQLDQAGGTTVLNVDTTNARIGIGTSAPLEALQVAGNVLIGAKADSTPARGPSSFTSANTSSTAGNFNGDTGRDGAFSSAEFNGKLYVATKENDASSIYRYDGANVWAKVTDAAGKIIAADTANIDYSYLSVFNGKLYAATYNNLGTACTTAATCSAVYSYDGTTWTLVNGTKGTYGATALTLGVTDMQVCNNHLYVATTGTATVNTAVIYRYDGGTTFTSITFAAGKFIVTGETAQVDAYNMVCYGGELVAGTVTGSGTNTARVAKLTGGDDAVTSTTISWVQLNNATNGSGGTFGAETLEDDVDSMTVFGGELYVAIGEPNLAAIYRYKTGSDRQNVVSTGKDFQRVTSTLGRIDSASDATDIDHIPVLRQYNGRLYAGSDTSAAGNLAGVYEYDPSVNAAAGSWTILNSAAGAPAADRGKFGSETGIDKVDTMLELNGTLYIGTEDSAGNNGSVYTWTKTLTNSYALKFDSGNSNYGAISFVGNLQAGDNNGHEGSFLFSNPVNLGGGAFDYAEDYPTLDSSLEPGDPVTVDPAYPEHVKKASADDTILGVVSENPGMRLSSNATPASGARWVPIALVGRVPVKVSTEGGLIKPGDQLTLSDTPGILKKASGYGQIVGSALEGYSGVGIGKIMLFVNPGWGGKLDTPSINISTLLSLKDASGKEVASFDQAGNATFLGTLTVDKLKANQIEGLQILAGKIAGLENQATADSATGSNQTTATGSQNGFSDLKFDGPVTAKSLVVLEGLEVKGGLIVDSTAQFNGLASFLGSVQFKDQVSFSEIVSFSSHVVFGNDSGGKVVIKKDAVKVDVKFDKPYDQTPIIVANYQFEDTQVPDPTNPQPGATKTDSAQDKQARLLADGYSYVVTNITKDGFTILINKPATEDIQLNWLANAIKDAKTTVSLSTAN